MQDVKVTIAGDKGLKEVINIDGLQGKTLKIREILEIAGIDTAQVSNVRTKDHLVFVRWIVTFKDNSKKYLNIWC